jgi:hypothetical protein
MTGDNILIMKLKAGASSTLTNIEIDKYPKE